MESWLTRAMKKAKKCPLHDRGTPGSPGGGEIGTPVFPHGQGSIFTPEEKPRRRKYVNKKKQPHPPASRSWNNTAEM